MKSGELFIPSELVSKIYTVYLVQAFIMNLPIYNIRTDIHIDFSKTKTFPIFFQIRELVRGSKFEDEIREEQEERKREEEKKAKRRMAFQEKAALFQAGN